MQGEYHDDEIGEFEFSEFEGVWRVWGLEDFGKDQEEDRV